MRALRPADGSCFILAGSEVMEISSVFLPGGLRKAQCVVGVESGSQRLNRLTFSYLVERE